MTELAFIIYYLISFLPGLISIFLTFYLFLKYKDNLFRYYCIAQIIICLFIVYMSMGIHRAGNQGPSFFYLLILYGAHLICGLFIAGLCFFFHSLLEKGKVSFSKRLFTGLISALPLLLIVLMLIFSVAGSSLEKKILIAKSGFYLTHSLAYIAICYIGISSIVKIGENSHNLLRQLVLPYSMLLLVFVPLWAADDYGFLSLFFQSKISLSPLLYFLWNNSCLVFAAGSLLHTGARGGVSLTMDQDFALKYKISERELEITNLILKGLSNKEIAAKLFISTKTVNNHIYKIYQKMSIRTRFELIHLVGNSKKS